jgi:hypothetical protein
MMRFKNLKKAPEFGEILAFEVYDKNSEFYYVSAHALWIIANIHSEN